jgi:hypothetical protein
MAGASVRRRGAGDPEATLDTSQSTPTASPSKSIPAQHKYPPAAVLPRGTKTLSPQAWPLAGLPVCAVRPGT